MLVFGGIHVSFGYHLLQTVILGIHVSFWGVPYVFTNVVDIQTNKNSRIVI